MAWCHQATSHYLSQCWPKSLSPYGITRPRWVKAPEKVNAGTKPKLNVIFEKINTAFFCSLVVASATAVAEKSIINTYHIDTRVGLQGLRHGTNLWTSFSNYFSCMKIIIAWLKFYCNLFPSGQLTISQHWFGWWLAQNRWWAIIWTNDGLVYKHIYIIHLWWGNRLWPSDAICHKFWSKLSQVMVYWLITSSHHLYHCGAFIY